MDKIYCGEQHMLLCLLNSSLWGNVFDYDENCNFSLVGRLAKAQGVTTFAYDGAKTAGLSIPADLKQSWKSQVLSGAFQNERLLIAQDAVIQRFTQANIPVAVLKGSSISRHYPQPELRALGDIDILIDGKHMAVAKELLLQEGYTECDYEHDFHIGFSKVGVYLELHEQVTIFPDTPGGQTAQEIANGFLDRLEQGTVCGYDFPVLCRSDQAMSLLLHMIRHMFEGGIGLRQLCDWMVFVAAESALFEEDVCPVLKRCGLLDFAEIATRTCVRYLGLSSSYCRWCAEADEQICALFIDAVFRGGNMGCAGIDAMGSLFTDEKTMGEASSPLGAFSRKMNRLIYKNFPFVERHKVLLPVLWIYLPFRYYARSIVGLRPRKSISKMVGTAHKQRNLFEELHLFEI